MSILETKNLSKTYGKGITEVKALNKVSLCVEDGEFVAVMGPSGSGKSTLLHLMGGLDSPTDGEVRIGDVEISRQKDKKVTLLRRNQIGFVFQFFNLLPTLTAEENILLPLIIAGKNPRNYKKKLERLLKLIGLEERRHHKPDQLSGGEHQRVAVARALITEPAILLADEPTGNLDSKNSRDILNLLKRSCHELGQTIVMVTHDPIAASYAHRVIFLQDGEIVRELKMGGDNDKEAIMACLKELEI